jgi:hypothetical protein
VAETFEGFAEFEWPGLVIEPSQGEVILDLDRTYSGLEVGSWIGLTGFEQQTEPAAAATPFAIALPVKGLTSAVRRDFLTSGLVHRIVTSGLRVPINPRTTTVHLLSQTVDAIATVQTASLVLLGDGQTDMPGQSPADPITLDGAIEGLAGRWASVSGLPARLAITGQAGGVRRLEKDGWVTAGSGNHNTYCLLRRASGKLWLGGEIDIRELDGDVWTVVGSPSLSRQCFALAERADGAVLAATRDGLWRYDGRAWESSGLAGTIVNALLLDGERTLAGTGDPAADAAPSDGLYLSTDGGATWPALPALPGRKITSLALTATGEIVAGAYDGTVQFQKGGGWISRSPPSVTRVLAVAASGGTVFAGTDRGLFRTVDGGASWLSVNLGEDPADVRAVVLDAQGAPWAAVRGRGVCGPDGTLHPSGVANDIRALLLDPDGVLYAGSQVATALLPDDGLLGPDLGEPSFLKQIHAPRLQDMLNNVGPVTNEVRRVFEHNGVALPDRATISNLSEDASSSGPWRIGTSGSAAVNVFSMGADQYRILLESVLTVSGPPLSGQAQGAPPGVIRWLLTTDTGERVTLDTVAIATGEGSTLAVDVDFGAPGDEAEPVSEAVRILSADIAADRLSTTIRLAAPLANVYDAAGATFCANVAPASHGDSGTLLEVVGSGDNSIANQSFPLQRKPVTAMASNDGQSARFSVYVFVKHNPAFGVLDFSNQMKPQDAGQYSVPWTQVDDFENSKPTDLHYTVRQDEDGSAIVTFGDGVNGRRLPTGQQNVMASYRVGSGDAGNLDAGRLTLPVKLPAGVQKVTNPVPAVGGADGDQLLAMRSIGPVRARALGRTVSERDLTPFLLAIPGVAKARLDILQIDGRAKLYFTIAASDDARLPLGARTLPPISLDLDTLSRSIRDSGPDKPPIGVLRYRPGWFDVAAELAILPEYDDQTVYQAARAALAGAFGFGNRALASPVRDTDILN